MRPRQDIFVVLASALALLCGNLGVAAAKSKPCAADLGKCPSRGCAEQGSGEALTNQMKRSMPKPGKPAALSLDDFQALQDQADDLVGQRKDLTKAVRGKLKKLKASVGEVAEGDLVEVTGYLVGSPHANVGGESVNCRLKGTSNNDFHISVAPDPDGTEFEGIVVEMVPQERPAGWTTGKLRRIAKAGRQVKIAGQLFYDNKHVVNADPDNVIGGQPKRFSLWEIHPVSAVLICQKEKCGADSVEWQKLEDVR